ncbi:MAG: hypothetical protein WDO73_32145 [Ignavibacteriota bacterium]
MLKDAGRNRAGHILWNVATVVSLIAVVLLYINNRQLAGSLTQLDQHDREQIAKLQQDVAQASANAEKSVERSRPPGARDRRTSRSPCEAGHPQD